MKRTISKLLGIGALAFAGFIAFSSQPVQAAVPCPTYPASPSQTANYALNGHIFNCMPSPRNVNEVSFQNAVLSRVNSAIADMTQDEKNKLSAKLVDIVVAYDRATAEVAAGLAVTPNGTMINETGRSYVLTNTNATVLHPTSLVWVYAPSQWNSSVIPSSLSSALGSQLTGTIHHEYGHQLDRVWAQTNGYSPSNATIVNNTTNYTYSTAIFWDLQHLLQNDRDTMAQQFPQFVQSTNPFTLKNNEIYAEEVAITNKGNLPTADTFIQQHFPCSRQFVITQAGPLNNGVPPAVPTSSFCYGNTHW